MEPPAAVAEWRDGKVVTYAATQNPQAVQEAVAGAMGIKKEDVTCHVTLLGGGFGRKSKPDYVCEAAMLSKQVGKPVKVVWSREDDIKFDFYHANAGMYMKAALDDKGRPTAWLHRSAFPSIGSTFDAAAEYAMELEMGMGWVDLPYAIANHRAENLPHKNHVRIGWMRAVAHIYHAFAVHSFVDELAAAANRDRVEYILDLLGPDRQVPIQPVGMKYWNNDQSQDKFPVDTGRLRRVLEVAAEKSGWANKKGAGRGSASQLPDLCGRRGGGRG
jgi:isoquinoline 1-oxidoreductase beta subunit